MARSEEYEEGSRETNLLEQHTLEVVLRLLNEGVGDRFLMNEHRRKYRGGLVRFCSSSNEE